jgi:hypothetical protein
LVSVRESLPTRKTPRHRAGLHRDAGDAPPDVTADAPPVSYMTVGIVKLFSQFGIEDGREKEEKESVGR